MKLSGVGIFHICSMWICVLRRNDDGLFLTQSEHSEFHDRNKLSLLILVSISAHFVVYGMSFMDAVSRNDCTSQQIFYHAKMCISGWTKIPPVILNHVEKFHAKSFFGYLQRLKIGYSEFSEFIKRLIEFPFYWDVCIAINAGFTDDSSSLKSVYSGLFIAFFNAGKI